MVLRLGVLPVALAGVVTLPGCVSNGKKRLQYPISTQEWRQREKYRPFGWPLRDPTRDNSVALPAIRIWSP